ncbi:MAG: SdrD B-like domain-containing protein, partial [Opitutales bacterium]|nr:SdrD B-like domain-containing protein [Opitutales bacterium]
MNGDGIVNLVDTIKMVNHIHGTGFTTELETLKWQADINGDGLVNSFDVESSLEFVFKRESIKSLPFAGIINTFPYAGEGDISLTREFVIHFNMPLAQGTVLTNEAFFAYSGDSLQVTSARLSSDRMKATLFLNGFRWPSNSTVTVTLNGGGLTDFIGRGIDVDGDGVEGGIKTWTFSTLGVEASDPSTIVEGQVFDSDNSNGEKPLHGVLITVVGNEEAMSVLTDSNGSFQLSSAPIGRFFVMVDGRLVGAPNGETLSQGSWKDRDYYTFVGKAWEAVPGKTVKATKYGKFAENGTYIADSRDGKIFLPLVKKGALKPVDATKKTSISFASGYLDGNDSNLMSMLAATSITIPPGSLQSDDGTTGGSVGMAPVAPDRLPEPLPESLKMPLVITIQTDGPSNFDIPVPARFPNVDNLPPGAKSALWSFDHDTGVWEISGPMTVSADGKFLETDPGVGIRQPGWHGSSPGAQVFGKAVTTGPSITKPKKGACGLSHASMSITEGDFTNLGRLSEGIEETIFGQNESDLSFTKDVLGAGNRFGNTQNAGGSDWNQFRTHAEKDAKLHATISRTVSTLLGSEDFWTTFSTTASTIRDNAIIASKNSSAQTKINSAHQVFLSDLNRAKAKISSQISKWENYSVSLSALIGQTTGISGHAVLQTDRTLIAKEISSTLKAYRSIPGGNSRLDKQLKKFAQSWQKFLQATLNGNLHLYKGESFVFLKRIGSEAEETRVPPIAAQRIRVGTGGSYDAIVRPNSWYEAWMLEPTTLVIGSTTFISPRNGGNGPVPPIPLCHDDKPDSDFDYLSDRGERIVGTNKSQPDTDGDGIPDGFEILNGTDPSGGNPVFTGILATIAPTRGFSDFVTTGNDLAILGNGPSGVDIFDIGSGVRPIKQSTFNTPGSVRKAALSENYLVIADGKAGLTVLDLTSIESPSQVWNIPQESPANAVAVAGKIAFVGLENGKIKSYDLFSGQKIDEIGLGQTIEDLGMNGDSLYALENVQRQRSRLHSVPTFNGRFKDDDGPFLPRNSVDTPGHRQWGLKNGLGRRLFVGDDFAYVTDLMGFNRIDLSDPTVPVRAERTKTPSRGWRQTVSNGSGLAIVLEHRNSPKFAKADPSIYTVQNNGDFLRAGGYMKNFETRFPTPGNAGAVSIYNGLAYVADGTKGLQVVNYRAYDINGVKPTLSVTLNDMNGTVEEAKLLTLRAFVQDDIQVKNVDFFVDGEKVFVDGGYPFAHTLEVPLRKDQATLRLRVIARDTGGNEAYWPGPGASNEHTLTIADDLVPPQVVTYFPRENSTVLPGETVVAVFNERMAPDSIHVRSIRLDRLNDNNTSTPIELASVVYDDATQSAYATLPATLPPAKYQLYVNELATDLPTNALKTPAPVRNLFGPSEIHGKFWFDRNHNTVQDTGEEILKEWTAFLDYNNNGELDTGEPNATSDQAGNYSFTNLYPGGYSVSEVLPHGWTQTFPKGQNLGATEQFTNVGWISESDQSANQTFAVDTLGNGWTAGIVPDGNFSIGSTNFDGNGTAGQLFIARVAPTGLVNKVVTLGNPDINNTGLSPNLIIKPDNDAGIWLTGSFSGNGLSIPGTVLDANNTTAFATRFDQDFNASLTTVLTNSTIFDLSPDPDGRVAIAGTFTGSTTMGTTTLTSSGGTDAFIAKIASTGKIAWAKSLGGSQWESVQSISTDVNGSLWIAGDSNSSNFTANTTNLDLSGNAGGYLAMYNQSGSNLWAIDPIGQVSLLNDGSAAWFLDQNGSTFLIKKVSASGTITSITSITGSIVTDLLSTTDGGVNVSLSTTSGTISVNGVNVSASTGNSGLLLKLKSNGDLAWSIPLSTNGSDSITQLARGSSPDTWAMGTVGTTNQSLTYGTKTIDLNSSTGVLLKIDPIGEVTSIWAIPVVGNLYVDVNDNVWVTGNNSGDPGQTRSITIGALPLQTESAKGNYIGRIGRAGSESHTIQLGSGEIQQNKNFGNSLPLIENRKAICVGGPNEDASRSVVTDSAGNAYYAGDFTGHTEFGGRKLKSDGQNDAMFVKFLPNGKIDWAKNFGGDGDDLGHAIFADDNGTLFASGTFQGTAKFGDFTLVSAGMRDIFVLRLDDNGTPTHAFRAGGPRDDDAFSLVADSNNSVYVGGAIEQTADFGAYQLTSQGNRDAYLQKLDYNLSA